MPANLRMDHIVVSAERLADGIAYVEQALGVKLAPGGEHPDMGTHNALLHLGDYYLEVIAINPDARAPDHPRWFDLDNFAGPPRITNWILRTDDLAAVLAKAPDQIGTPKTLSRGDFNWTVTVPRDGKLPFDGAFAGFIDWGTGIHPAQTLPDIGCRLKSWRVTSPDARELSHALDQLPGEYMPEITQGPLGFMAEIDTSHGVRTLS